MATEQSESQPGKIWFYTVKKSFADVQIDETNQHIDTSDFLDATESLLPLFGNRATALSQMRLAYPS